MTAYDKAIQILKIRPHHSNELAKKLLMRGFNREEIDAVILKLADQRLIDNDLFAQNYLDELLRTKTFGFYGLKAKLMQRGIEGNLAEKLLKENFSLEKEKQIAQRVMERQARNMNQSERIKLAQKLQRKGFRGEVISDLLRSA